MVRDFLRRQPSVFRAAAAATLPGVTVSRVDVGNSAAALAPDISQIELRVERVWYSCCATACRSGGGVPCCADHRTIICVIRGGDGGVECVGRDETEAIAYGATTGRQRFEEGVSCAALGEIAPVRVVISNEEHVCRHVCRRPIENTPGRRVVVV